MINRKKVYLENIKASLSLAIMLKDELSPDKKVIGEVYLKASGIRKAIIRHRTGYFLFVDLPKGKRNLTAGGEFYAQEDFHVDYGQDKLTFDNKLINQEQPFTELYLKPKASYPFPEGITVLKGRVVDMENKPIPKTSIKIKGMKESAISEEDGDFFIHFSAIDRDKDINLTINNKRYKIEEVPVILKKGVSTRIEAIRLIEK